jgi:acyl-coenzyme A thioesterase PaaI-like protein
MGTPTISMSMDFLATGQLHDWIWADVETLKITNTMGFAQGVVRRQDNTILMRANGSFKLPKSLESVAGITVSELLAMKGID